MQVFQKRGKKQTISSDLKLFLKKTFIFFNYTNKKNNITLNVSELNFCYINLININTFYTD